MNLRKAIHSAVEFDNLKLKAVSDELGIPLPTLSRFVNEKRGMQFDFLERICEFLELQLFREIVDFDAYCRRKWEDGGREWAIEDLEYYKDQDWEEYVEEHWEPDEREFEKLEKERWKEYAREEWPAYAESEDLDVTDGEESQSWKDYVYHDWFEKLREEWEQEAKEQWIESEFDEWSAEFDHKLEDDDYLYEHFCKRLKESISEESWIIVRS